jgi:hypothetical protein
VAGRPDPADLGRRLDRDREHGDPRPAAAGGARGLRDTDRAGSAIAALPVRPRLRADASAAAVTLTALRLPVRLVDDQQTRVNQHPSGSADAGPIGWVEVVP